MTKLKGKKIAFLVENGFEEVELTKPREAFEKEGATCHIVSPQKDKVKAWAKTDWGDEYKVDVELSKAEHSAYDALVLPGGVLNPAKLRRNENAVSFVKKFFDDDKWVAVICHGAQTMIEADLVNGREMTAYNAIKKDMINAGVRWTDKEVVVDGRLISSRNPGDIPAFNQTVIDSLS